MPLTRIVKFKEKFSPVSDALLRFCRARLGETFHADDARHWVMAEVGMLAPGTTDRILRKLRQDGLVNYSCISSQHSLYSVDAVWSWSW